MNDAVTSAEAAPAAGGRFSILDSDVFVSIALVAMAALFMCAARYMIGLTLGTAFLPVFIAPILAAYLPRRFSLAATLAWLIAISIATMLPLIGLPSWIQLTLLTLTCAAVIQQTAALLSPLPPPPPTRGGEDAIAQTIVILIWLAWLTWPIWLAHAWTQPAVAPWLDRLLPYNPIAAIGGVLSDLGDWTHQPSAYTYLLNLGQDVAYAPLPSAWPAIFAHGSVVGIMMIAKNLRRKSGPSPPGRG